jgi:hypothetical protein
MCRVGKQAQHVVVAVGLGQRERRDEDARIDELRAQVFRL